LPKKKICCLLTLILQAMNSKLKYFQSN